jgi:DNA invertase Pin-like site-specific DNA recombinase
MNVTLYWRTSEFETQSGSANGARNLDQALADEEQQLVHWCNRRGWTLHGRVVETNVPWNADFANREGGAALLARLQPGDALLVFALERLFSSCYDAVATLQDLRERGIALYVLALDGDVTNPALTLDVLTAAQLFAGLERRRSVERIRNVKKNQRSKGRYLGGSRPFGYMIHSNGRLIENPMEQKVLKRILQLRDQGRSLRAIAAEVSTPVAPISFKTVQRILLRHV